MLPVITVSFLLEVSTLVLARSPAFVAVNVLDRIFRALAGKELAGLFEGFPCVIIFQNFDILQVELLELFLQFIAFRLTVNCVVVVICTIQLLDDCGLGHC